MAYATRLALHMYEEQSMGATPLAPAPPRTKSSVVFHAGRSFSIRLQRDVTAGVFAFAFTRRCSYMKTTSLAAKVLALLPKTQAARSKHCCLFSAAPSRVVISCFSSIFLEG